MRYFVGKFLQLSGMVTLAGALTAGFTEPTLWNELTLMLVGPVVVLIFWYHSYPVGRTGISCELKNCWEDTTSCGYFTHLHHWI